MQSLRFVSFFDRKVINVCVMKRASRNLFSHISHEIYEKLNFGNWKRFHEVYFSHVVNKIYAIKVIIIDFRHLFFTPI